MQRETILARGARALAEEGTEGLWNWIPHLGDACCLTHSAPGVAGKNRKTKKHSLSFQSVRERSVRRCTGGKQGRIRGGCPVQVKSGLV